MGRTNAQITEDFTYQAPTEKKRAKYDALREALLSAALLVNDLCPDSQQKSNALTHLEMARMMANAAIATNKDED